MNNPILPWLAAAIIVLLVLSWGRIPRWLESRPHRVTVRSEVHGLLELAIKQNTALIEIRDALREMSRPVYANRIADAGMATVAAINELRAAVQEGQSSDKERAVNAEWDRRQMDLFEKIVGLLGQVRDYAELSHAKAGNEANAWEVWMKAWDKFWKENMLAAADKVALIAEAQPKILAQLEQNDKRMFEFVSATKGIMKAMNGEGYEEDDVLIDEARRIKSYAADQGVELTLEEAVKRARSKRTYARS